MKIRRSPSLLLITSAATLLASCQTPYHKQEERYVFIASNINLPYWQEAQAGLQDAAKQMGVKAEVDGPDKLDAQEELKAFQKAADSKPSGILVSVARPELFQSAINAAIAVRNSSDRGGCGRARDQAGAYSSERTISAPGRKARNVWPRFCTGKDRLR
jgi:ABC-type sugar transport system substrate-binding protein